MEKKFGFTTNTIIIKIIVVAVLTLLMLIPVSMIRSLIEEREKSQQDVQDEISSKWGGSQKVTGPILVLPYESGSSNKNQENTISYAYFLPDDYKVEGTINAEERARTLYKTLVYQSKLHISGEFKFPDYEKLNIKDEQVRWEDAFFLIDIPYLQGIKNKIVLNVNGEPLNVSPSVKNNDITDSGLSIKMPIDRANATGFKFDFDLNLNGSKGLYLVPVGKENRINLKSDWKTVSFGGIFLPNDRTIDNNGFDAKWDIFDYNRNYIQMWVGSNESLQSSTLGMEFKFPVDQYQMSMRSVKYAIMFIALTFVIFFLIELLSQKRIHPVQYLLVSIGLVLFYSLLLALSEHISFSLSYLCSAIATIALITTYSSSIFRDKKQTLLMGGFLTTLYIYLYVVLQLEDLALLFGSVGLFIVLAIVMYVSRKVNWYKPKENKNIDNNETPPPFNQSENEIVQ